MASILIKGGTVVTMNPKREIIEPGDVFIRDSRIEAVGPSGDLDVPRADKVIDASGKAVIPGLIQTHVHLCQTLFRGQADDLELLDWLRLRIWPLEGAHDQESIYYSALLGIAELIKSGTTSIIDMETVHHTDHAITAIMESGIRAITGKVMMDYGDEVPPTLREDTDRSIQESVELCEKWHMADGGRIRYAFTPRFVVSCTERLLVEVRDLARKYGVHVHTHASENRGECELVLKDRGMRNVDYLYKIGLLGPNLILAHCIWLDRDEMEMLKVARTKVAHCPSSNLKLASGIAKIPEMLDMGVQVSLGADGAPCNNNLDQFVEMRHAALIQKPRLGPTAMPAAKVFEMATLAGAEAMGMESELGQIAPGFAADIAVVDLGKVHSMPSAGTDVISRLVYSARGSDVVTTIVDGKVLMENRRLTTIDEDEVIRKANEAIVRVAERAGIAI